MHPIRNRRTLIGSAVVLGAAIVLAGCSSSIATFPPEGATTAPATAAATPVATSAPTAATAEPTATQAATLTPAPTDTPAPSETPTATPTGTPGPSPTSTAAACTGNATNKAFIAEAASKLSFTVYCAVLPSSWWVQSGKYTLPNGGLLQLAYKNSAGATINLSEGNICPTICAAAGIFVGNYMFGDLPATLYTLSGAYMLFVGPIGTPSYLMTSTGVSQSNFVAWAAALRKVPKS